MYILKMSFLNLCLKLPNLGIIIYHLFFILIIPYICIGFNKTSSLKYYWPFLIGFANILTISYEPHMFKDLYQLSPNNKIAFVSSSIINLIAVMGIIWQCIDVYSLNRNNMLIPVLSGVVMFLCTFPLSREGIKYVVNKSNKLFKKNNSSGSKLLVGISTLIIIIAFNLIALQMVKNMGSPINKNMRKRLSQQANALRRNRGTSPNNLSRKPPALPKQSPIQTPKQSPIQTPKQSPIQTPKQSPKQTPKQSSVQTPTTVTQNKTRTTKTTTTTTR